MREIKINNIISLWRELVNRELIQELTKAKTSNLENNQAMRK
jgi:hypothetical protein